MSIIKVKTVSGSVYEIDESKKLIRRHRSLDSGHSERVSDVWKPYIQIDNMEVGMSMSIVWSLNTPMLAPTVKIAKIAKRVSDRKAMSNEELLNLPLTLTSVIESIEKQ